MNEKAIADRINDRVVNSNTLWNCDNYNEQREIITDIVIEETGYDAIENNDEIIMIVNKLCEKYNVGSIDDEIEDGDEPDDYNFGTETYELHEWIESHDDITPEVLEEALNSMEKLSRFDYDPSEFNRRMYELAEYYEIDEEEIEEYLD